MTLLRPNTYREEIALFTVLLLYLVLGCRPKGIPTSREKLTE